MEENSRNTRIDVQVKLKKIVELMQRPQGAAVREVCEELCCNPKTFYRYLDKLLQLDIPYESKPDPNGETNSVRYYVSEKAEFFSDVSLNSTEKALFKMMIQNAKPIFSENSSNPELTRKFYEKLNKEIFHETKESEVKYVSDKFTLEQNWQINKNFQDFSKALDLKQSITFKSCKKSGLKNEEEFYKDEDKSFFLTYNLINKDGIFYAIGKVIPSETLDDKNDKTLKIRCVKLDCVTDIKLYKQYNYSISPDYDFSKWYDYFFKNENQSKNYHLEVDEQTLSKIKNACEYYPVKEYTEKNKTHLIFNTDKKEEFAEYIRTLGNGVKILEPENFAKEILKDYKNIISKYDDISKN